jgi:hypothetical protein
MGAKHIAQFMYFSAVVLGLHGLNVLTASASEFKIESAQLTGYMHARVRFDGPAERYNRGFSMYATVWPLLKTYPGRNFQTGLLSTWMFAALERKPEEKIYSDIEGGLGWWRHTKFASTTPKFLMGGVALNFQDIADGPGIGKGTWQGPSGKYGAIQLSKHVLWPLDGLNIKAGTNGQLFGYGYLALPLVAASAVTDGAQVPTGNNCWTLFINAGNFKGPLTFFAPAFFSRPTIKRPDLAGMFLDARFANPNQPASMETQYIPAFIATNAQGHGFARIAATRFPHVKENQSLLLADFLSYDSSALYDAMQKWMAGGELPSGSIDRAASYARNFTKPTSSSWSIYTTTTPKEQRVPVAWSDFFIKESGTANHFSLLWNNTVTAKPNADGTSNFHLPEYYQLDSDDQGKKLWRPITQQQLPANCPLTSVTFPLPDKVPSPAIIAEYNKQPAPAAGPFLARLGDGTTVKYYWYRFADQPALQFANLSPEEREALQQRVTQLHQQWTPERNYLPPPEPNHPLAEIDPALVVKPPRGLENGYVPIAVEQGKTGK